jgi:hypothetical protein
VRADKDRRFTLVDGMILVAATAGGLALTRTPLAEGFWESFLGEPELHLVGVIHAVLLLGLPLLLMWTFALVVVRLRHPRPRFRRLASQPGFVACVAAASAMTLCTLSMIPLLAWSNAFSYEQISLRSYTPEAGFAVAGAWLSLALGRRWRAEPGWIDRTGRGLGVTWILANFLSWLQLCLL